MTRKTKAVEAAKAEQRRQRRLRRHNASPAAVTNDGAENPRRAEAREAVFLNAVTDLGAPVFLELVVQSLIGAARKATDERERSRRYAAAAMIGQALLNWGTAERAGG